uniref:Uncharacterized protein n=1 Tax=Panagrolaimus sp. ES5 TaxID=591445 RepID=A0AC34GDF8_9BILA
MESESGVKSFKVDTVDGKFKTALQIPTFNPRPILDFQFEDPAYPGEDGKLQLNNVTTLLELLKEINTKESAAVKFNFCKTEDNCACFIIVNESFMKTSYMFTKASKDVHELSSLVGTHVFPFRSRYVKNFMKAVRQSSKLSLRVNSNGFLCVQCDISKIYGYHGMIEFFVVPLDPEYDVI